MAKQKTMFYLDSDLISKMDSYLKTVGCNGNRSGLVSDAVEYYLKVKMGFRFKSLK